MKEQFMLNTAEGECPLKLGNAYDQNLGLPSAMLVL